MLVTCDVGDCNVVLQRLTRVLCEILPGTIVLYNVSTDNKNQMVQPEGLSVI